VIGLDRSQTVTSGTANAILAFSRRSTLLLSLRYCELSLILNIS
jgi:hypothetical protein